ncbi:MAG: MBL fold metallo-hydrolase [Myxococcaceae bacterium]|nr:MBL fold metallo-hydrolase [Myxococcaceae bacterium]
MRMLLAVCCFLAGCGLRTFLQLEAVRIDDGLEVWLGGGGNSVGVLHGRQAFLSDVKFADFGMRLRHDLEDTLRLKVSRVMLTHAHQDHAGSLALYPEVGAVLVHPNAKKRLLAQGERAPFVEVDGEIRLFLGEEEVRVLNLGSGHTDGDLVAYLPKRKWVVAGDLVNEDLEPRADQAYGGDVLVLAHTVQRILELDFTHLVPGHGQVMPRSKVEHFGDYLKQLEAGIRAEVTKGSDEDTAVRAVQLQGFDDIKTAFYVPSREGTTRAMFQSVKKETEMNSSKKETP